jgi:AraC-like DNA-binding protein
MALTDVQLRLQPREGSPLTRGQLKAFDLAHSRVSFLALGIAMRTKIAASSSYALLLPIRGRAEVRMAGKPPIVATPGTGVVIAADVGADLYSSPGYAHVAIAFPARVVHRELRRHLRRDVTGAIDFSREVDLGPVAGAGWRRLLRVMEVYSRNLDSAVRDGMTAQRLERDLLTQLVLTQPHRYSRELPRLKPVDTRNVAQRAIEMIEEHPDRLWTVAELASAVWSSTRALQESFNKLAGVSPTVYLRWSRLHKVRDELMRSAPDRTTVHVVATRWGFSHMGRFSAAYFQKFSEYPRETLRAARVLEENV